MDRSVQMAGCDHCAGSRAPHAAGFVFLLKNGSQGVSLLEDLA